MFDIPNCSFNLFSLSLYFWSQKIAGQCHTPTFMSHTEKVISFGSQVKKCWGRKIKGVQNMEDILLFRDLNAWRKYSWSNGESGSSTSEKIGKWRKASNLQAFLCSVSVNLVKKYSEKKVNRVLAMDVCTCSLLVIQVFVLFMLVFKKVTVVLLTDV